MSIRLWPAEWRLDVDFTQVFANVKASRALLDYVKKNMSNRFGFDQHRAFS